MKFEYRAANSDSAIMMGALDADSERSAIRSLKRQGLVLISIRSEMPADLGSKRKSRRPGTRDVLIYMHQLCTLLESGIPIKEAVESLAESSGHPFIAREFENLLSALKSGHSFSEALRECKLRLPGYFQPLCEAGELTGKMAQAMRDSVKQWEYDVATAGELRNALTYPTILIVSGTCAILLIFALVVPRFASLLNKGSQQIPFLARFVLGMGTFINQHFPVLISAVAILMGFGTYCARSPNLRQKVYDLLARFPLLRHWIMEVSLGKWSGMLATLLENKVPLLKALELAQRQIGVSSLVWRFTRVCQAVRNGEPLAKSLLETSAVDATGYNLIRVGEHSGNLPDMLHSLSSLYIQSGRNRMKRFLLLLEPVAIIVIGAIVGLVMAGIILAITSVNNIAI